MENITVAHIIGMLVGAFIIVAPVVRWILKDWLKAKKTLADQEAKTVSNMQKAIENLGTAIGEVKTETHTLKMKLESQVNVTKDLIEKIEAAEKRLKDQATNLDILIAKKVDERVAATLKTEIKNLTNQLMLIKTKKGNGA